MKEDLYVKLKDIVSNDALIQIIADPFSSRVLKIGNYQAIPYGGTHVEHIKDIGAIDVVSIKKIKEKIRIRYEVVLLQ